MKRLFSKSIVKNIYIAIFFAIFIALNIMIIYLAAENGEQSTQTSNSVGEVVATAADSIGIHVDKNSEAFKNFIRKFFGHFSLFFFTSLNGVLSIIFLKNNPQMKRIVAYVFLGYGLILAIVTEVIQIFAGSRNGNFADVLIDFLGYAIPMGIYLGLSFFIYRKSRDNVNYIEV